MSIMYNRRTIAQNFANKIKSDDIDKIILYGSVARGDDKEESDIDIFIVSSKARDLESKINDEVVEVVLDTKQLISPHIMTVEHFNKTKNNSFLQNVLKDGISLV